MSSRFSLLLAAALSCTALAVPNTTTTINQSALTRFFQAAPMPSGSMGHFELTGYRPCSPNWWNVCSFSIYSSEVTWSVSTPAFSISPSGITATVTVNASYAGYSFSQSASATVNVAANRAGLTISLSSVSLPVSFNLPLYGTWSPGTLTVSLSGLSFTVPMPETRVEVPGGTAVRGIQLHTTTVSIAQQPGALVVSSEHVPW